MLPVHVGIAMRYGLSFEQALQAVTINPARLLKLQDRIGSLEAARMPISPFSAACRSPICRCVKWLSSTAKSNTERMGITHDRNHSWKTDYRDSGDHRNGTLLIEDGKITAIGTEIEVPSEATVIDAAGQWVTPGLIDAHSHLSGLNEPAWMPSVMDANEITSPVTAQVRMLDAFNPFDIAIAKVRNAGFTTCCTLPGSANVIGGYRLQLQTEKQADSAGNDDSGNGSHENGAGRKPEALLRFR